ncbi:MAG: nucleoside recognition protein [Firmicutes bacterium]|nr:nucleoside recognition protein [Bacillota bacterium]
MINRIWLGFLSIGVVAALVTGQPEMVTRAVTEGSELAVHTAIGLVGTMAFWLGLMGIAEDAGLIITLAGIIRPFVRWLFPDVPLEHPAMGTILLNMGANLLGLGNAATPLGLKAMAQLQELNAHPDLASNSMCTLLAINTSSITLVPTMVIAVRAAAGSLNPAEILGTTIIATTCSTAAALIVDAYCRYCRGPVGGGKKC